MHVRPIALPAGLALAASLAGTSPTGQDVLDRGAFQIYRDGRPVGHERFAIRSERSGNGPRVTAIGAVQLEREDGTTLEIHTALEAAGPDYAPTGYQVEVTGDGRRRVAGTVQRGRFLARILSPRGERWAEYAVSEGALILDQHVVHHHYFVALRAARGIARVPVLVPQENRVTAASVEVAGVERTAVGDRTEQLTHIVLRPEGEPARHLWTDERYRVRKLEIPETGFLAIRTEGEGL